MTTLRRSVGPARRCNMRPSSAIHISLGHARINHEPTAQLPDSVDLSSFFSGIRDQGSEGSCTGMATAAAREILAGSKSSISCQLSPAYLYARTRIAEGTFPEDAGAMMADEFSVLQAFGVCHECDMPYDLDPSERPSVIADASARQFRISMASTVDLGSPTKAMEVLSLGLPIGIAIPVYESFEGVGPDGIVPIPAPSKEALLGGHGLCLAGYDAPRRLWRGINSWGKSWGDHGFFWLPMDGYPVWEAWTGIVYP